MKSIAINIFCLLLQASVWGAVKPGDFVTSGPTGQNKIALSFDDGPGVETEAFVRLLDQYKAKATFFMLGEQAKLRPKAAKLVADKGHEIASHTWNHRNYAKATAAQKKELVEDMQKSRQAIEEATGASLKICRMPHGIDRPWIKEAAKDTGFVLVNWTYGSDWVKEDEAKSKKAYINAIKPGAILLFHDGGRRREKSLALTEAVLKAAQEKGYEIVTVGQLIGVK